MARAGAWAGAGAGARVGAGAGPEGSGDAGPDLRDVHAAGGLEAVVADGHRLLVQQVAQLVLLYALLAHRPAHVEPLVQ